MTSTKVLGIDIGGANIKYATSDGQCLDRIFPMWQTPDALAEALACDLQRFSDCQQIAVTMTGELADCFQDRRQGVIHICDHVRQACEGREIWVYGVDGCFHEIDQATKSADLVAAANWHALANWTAARWNDACLLVDIGSTTTDLIPLAGGRVSTDARTDFDRLSCGALVYVGCRRTPVCALVNQLDMGSQSVPVMNEVFATIDDALIILGLTQAEEHDCETADHQPRTVRHATNRLARMIGLDHRSVSESQSLALADQVLTAARQRISRGLKRQRGSADWKHVVVSGHGEALLPVGWWQHQTNLADQLGPTVARCAPSFAVANLLAGQRHFVVR
ncbi:MAG: hydantoinase/oxoprolinase family protein [Planctomycetota bacterium]